jgi:hypothetical protein
MLKQVNIAQNMPLQEKSEDQYQPCYLQQKIFLLSMYKERGVPVA